MTRCAQIPTQLRRQIMDVAQSFHQFWSLPLQVGVTLWLLYRLVKWAFLAGVVVLMVFLPLNTYVSKRIGQLTQQMMAKKDERVRLCNEALHGIRLLKMQAWEAPMMARICLARSLEIKYLAKRKCVQRSGERSAGLLPCLIVALCWLC